MIPLLLESFDWDLVRSDGRAIGEIRAGLLRLCDAGHRPCADAEPETLARDSAGSSWTTTHGAIRWTGPARGVLVTDSGSHEFTVNVRPGERHIVDAPALVAFETGGWKWDGALVSRDGVVVPGVWLRVYGNCSAAHPMAMFAPLFGDREHRQNLLVIDAAGRAMRLREMWKCADADTPDCPSPSADEPVRTGVGVPGLQVRCG